MQDAMDTVSSFFASLTKGAKKPPTAAEIEEYCRDPESSGCDLDMMDALMAEAAKLKAKGGGADTEIRWSADIDEAVFKCD